MDPRRIYVSLVRRLRGLFESLGLIRRMERSSWGWVRHLRTMFAIYDTEDLARVGLPWWNYGAIEAVERFLETRPQPRVFEYGSGASTLWLADRAALVTSVEHDAEHVERMRGLLDGYDNVDLIHVAPTPADDGASITSGRRGEQGKDFSDYVDAIWSVDGPFDLVVIDGRARVDCLPRAVQRLSDGGLIVFDDIRRRRYRAALDYPGLETEVTVGATPSVPFPTSTGLLRRSPR